jgi:hypothetical protein
MELLRRYSGLKQRMIGKRLGGLDEGLVSRDRRAIRKTSRLSRRSGSGFRISPADLILKSRFDPREDCRRFDNLRSARSHEVAGDTSAGAGHPPVTGLMALL